MQLHTVCVKCGTPYTYTQKINHGHPFHEIACKQCKRTRLLADKGGPLTPRQRVMILEGLQMTALTPEFTRITKDTFAFHGDLPIDPRDKE